LVQTRSGEKLVESGILPSVPEGLAPFLASNRFLRPSLEVIFNLKNFCDLISNKKIKLHFFVKLFHNKISPTFSSGKMRKMHPLIEDCVERLETVLMKKATDNSGNNEIELKKSMGNLTMDVIALCAFGTKIDTHNDPKNQFIKKAEVVLRGNWRLWVFFLLKTTIPKILDLTQFQVTDPSVAHFFRSANSLS
jgi:hypothetical protein